MVAWLFLNRHDRSSVVIATKVRFTADLRDPVEPNESGLSRGSILTNLERSLKRLQTDYIDVYYVSVYLSYIVKL